METGEYFFFVNVRRSRYLLPQVAIPMVTLITKLHVTVFLIMSQAGKKNVTRPGLEPRVSRLPCEHSNR